GTLRDLSQSSRVPPIFQGPEGQQARAHCFRRAPRTCAPEGHEGEKESRTATCMITAASRDEKGVSVKMHPTAEFDSTIQWIVPVIVAIVFILLCSLMKEPNRKNFMAIIVGGAGAAYLSGGGFGKWELAFCTLMAICAYNGLRSYRFIGIGWLLHTGWDILHPLYGNPILAFDPRSSLRYAICDPVI